MPTGNNGFILHVNVCQMQPCLFQREILKETLVFMGGRFMFLSLSRAEKWLLDIATFIML